MLLRLVTLGLVVTSAGCLSGGPTADELARLQSSIINGVASDSSDDNTVLIPLLQNGQLLGACSGSIVAPNLILTARHCVSDTDEVSNCDVNGNALAGGMIYGDRMPSDIGVIVGPTVKYQLDASGTQFFVPPGNTLCNSDIALVLLNQPLPNAKVEMLRLSSPPTAGELLRAVGWGTSNNSTGYGRRRRDNIPVLEVGPEDDVFSAVGSHEFQVGESICSGDSGSPAMDEGTSAVVGVVSRGGNGKMVNPMTDPQYANCVDGGGYTTLNLYTRVDGFVDLFTQAFAAAGTDPWVEGGPDPSKAKTGEACTSNDACRSAICVDPLKAGYCSQTCDDTPGSCADPMKCEKDGTTMLCKLPGKGGCEMGASRNVNGLLPILFVLFALALRRRRLMS